MGASTIRRVLQRLGIPPAPLRDTDTTRRQFLRAQASTMLACDLFHVDCAVTLQRIYVFFVLEVASRSVHLLSTTTNPDGRGTTQQVQHITATIRRDVAQRLGGLLWEPTGKTSPEPPDGDPAAGTPNQMQPEMQPLPRTDPDRRSSCPTLRLVRGVEAEGFEPPVVAHRSLSRSSTGGSAMTISAVWAGCRPG
jgi:hypothetical protein